MTLTRTESAKREPRLGKWIVIGVAAGLLGITPIVFGWWKPKAPRSARPAASNLHLFEANRLEPPTLPADPVSAATERARGSVVGPSTADLAENASPPLVNGQPVSREDARKAALERWQADVQAHELEPVDPSWSSATGRSLSEDVAGIAREGAFRLLGAVCKTTTCSAALEWPSYDDAMKSYEALLHGDFRANCTRGILLPEPEDRALPYRGRLLLDCENWRAETM